LIPYFSIYSKIDKIKVQAVNFNKYKILVSISFKMLFGE